MPLLVTITSFGELSGSPMYVPTTSVPSRVIERLPCSAAMSAPLPSSASPFALPLGMR